MAGWIKLHRKILENPIVCKDSDHLAVWTYLLLNATHKEQPKVFGGEKIMLQPGQLITGRKAISEKFNISESKVQRILKSFEIEQQIEQQNGNKNRLISVLSWGDYQESEQQFEQQVNNKRTTDEQQVNTNKNVKKERTKENKEKDIKPSSSRNKKTAYSEDDRYYQMALYFHEQVMNHAVINNIAHLIENADMQKWADEFRKIVELDKREVKEIGDVVRWCTTDSFWQVNILSPVKLRRQYVQLAAKMKGPKTFTAKQQRNAEQIDVLKNFCQEGRGNEQAGNSDTINSHKTSFPQLRNN